MGSWASLLGFPSPFWLSHSLWIRSPRKADCKPSVDANPYKRALGHQCLVFNLLSGLTTAYELEVQGRLIANLVLMLIPINGILGINAWFQSPFWLNHSLWIRSSRKADCKPSVDANPYKRVLGHQCLVFNLLSGLTTACEFGVQGRLIANPVLMLISINKLLCINACFSISFLA